MFLSVVAMCAMQHFMSRRNNRLWGGIVPIIFVAVMTWLYITGGIEHVIKYIVLLIVGLLLLLGEWSRGQKSLRKQREEELIKMKAQDLK